MNKKEVRGGKSKSRKELFLRLKDLKHKEIIVFSLIMLVVYLSTMSCSFDDEDSILFVKGMRDYNVAEYQPHPPGYPVYIFLAKIFNFIIRDELLAMTTLSAVCGALSLFVFYFLILEMFDKKIALMSTILMAVTPMFWLNSLQAMSDMVGLLFTLLSMYFIYIFIKYKKTNQLYISSFVSAIALGIRLQIIFIVFPLFIYAYIVTKDKKKIGFSILIFIIGVLIWLVPMMILSGTMDFDKVMLSHSSKVFYESVLGGLIILNFLAKVEVFLKFFLVGSYGINLWEFNIFGVFFLLIFLFVLMLSYERLKNKAVLFFLIALVPNIVLTFFILPACNPRYLISFIPFISLLFTFGTFWFKKYGYFVFGILLVLLLAITFPMVKEIHTTSSPTTQAINYILENYKDLNNTIIYRDFILEGYFEINGIETPPSSMDFNLKNGSYKNKTVFLVKGCQTLSQEDSNLTRIIEFKRNLGVAPKIYDVCLYKLEIP